MNPKISVIVVAYNEEKLLPRCLESILKQSYPKEDYEVILIDNGSKDKTAQIGKELGVQVHTYTEAQGCSPSRNFGVTKAKGSIITFMDADCSVPKDWLAKIEKALTDPEVVCVGGKAVPDKSNLWTNFVFAFYHWFNIVNHAFGKGILWGFNMAMKKTAYDEVKGFNTTLMSTDDWDLVLRIQKRFGRKSVRLVSDIEVITSTRKQDSAKVFYKYALDGVRNYVGVVLLGKTKVAPVFNTR